MRKWVVLLGSALLFACGGSGSSAPTGGPAPEQQQSVSMGLVRGDAVTTAPFVVTKPFTQVGFVDLAEEPAGAFDLAGGALPLAVAAGEKAVVWVSFAPPSVPADAIQRGTIRLVFRREVGDATFPVTLLVDAEIEKPSARLVQTQLQLGSVPVGERIPCGIHFENTSHVTPVRVSDVNLSAGDFSFAPDAFAVPTTVAPGATYLVRLVYAPASEATASSLLRVFHSAATDPLEAVLGASGIASQAIVEFGLVPVDPVTHLTDWLSFDVAPEGVGIFIEAWGEADSVIDLAGFEGPSSTVYETEDLTGPLNWLSGYPAGGRGFLNVGLPDSARPEVQLVAGGGTYRFRLRSDAATELVVRATVSQRRLGEASEGTLDIRVFLADGLAIADRSDPMRDPKLSAAMKTIDAILGESGIRLGDVMFTFMEPTFNVIGSEDDADSLLVVNSPLPPEGTRLNLMFVKEITSGVAALAGSSPGLWMNGLPYSGVVAEYDSASGIVVGVRAAHVIGHYLGSFGTSVFQQSDAAHVMLRHPLVRPGLPDAFLSPPGTYEQAQVMANSLPQANAWCGACTHAPIR